MPLSGFQLIERRGVPAHKRRLYMQGSALTVLGNVILLLAKGVAAYMSRSSAIYADAANSAADVAYSLLMGLGLWLSLRPADATHPHGHRRIESLVGVLIGVAMGVAGAQALRRGVDIWRKGAAPVVATLPMLLLLGSALAKGLMYLIMRRIGEAAKSPALAASARDNLADLVSSGMALLGVLSSRLIFAADPVAALLVSVWIFRSACQVLRDSLRQLIGGSVAPELTQAVLNAAQAVPGVLDVHQIIIEQAGPLAYVDMHIDMEGSAALYEVHRVSDAVREAVEGLEAVDHAFVHVEPIES